MLWNLGNKNGTLVPLHLANFSDNGDCLQTSSQNTFSEKRARSFLFQRLHFFLLTLSKKLVNQNCFTDQEILRKLEKEKILVFTPSRRVQGRRVVCYDDRFIVKLAYDSDGIIVSNDNYRDLQNEKPEWKKFIEERLLMYSFVNDKYVFSFKSKGVC